MTSVAVPDNDLAPNLPSREVTISATNVTEGGVSLRGQWVNFALSDSIDVTPGGDMIAKTSQTITLDSAGNGRIRLPVYDTGNGKGWESGKDWAIIVTTSWGSSKAIRVPQGSGSIPLSYLPAVRPLSRAEMRYAVTGVSLSVGVGSTPGQASGTATLDGGILRLGLTVPPTGAHSHSTSDITGLDAKIKEFVHWRGKVPNGTNIATMRGKAWRGSWGVGEDTTGTQIGSLSGLPELIQGVLTVDSTDTGFTFQTYKPFNRAYFYWRSATSLSSATWTAWGKTPQDLHKAIPNGTDLNDMATKSWRGDWGVGEDTTGTQISSLSNLPEVVQGVLTVRSTNTGFSTQVYYPYARDYFYWRSATNIKADPKETTWGQWQKVGESNDSAPVRHDILVSEMRRYTTVPPLAGAAPVAIIFDHGTNNFRDVILPKLTARGLAATLALNSDMYNPSAPRYAHDNDTTWAEIDSWPVEIANHGRTHGAMSSSADLRHEIVDGLEELRSHLPSKRIHAWVQTGQSGTTTWQGFENGKSSETWATSAAGSLIWEHHAISTGAVATSQAALYDMTGLPHQGVWGYWLDTPAGITTAKARIADAVSQGRGIILRAHPELLNGSGNTTSAEMLTFLDWLADRQAAGDVKTVTFSQWSLVRTLPR